LAKPRSRAGRVKRRLRRPEMLDERVVLSFHRNRLLALPPRLVECPLQR
jgi:hypothetical protein